MIANNKGFVAKLNCCSKFGFLIILFRVSLCERRINEKFKTGLINFSPKLQFAASTTSVSPDSVHSGSKINSNPELVHSETQTEWKLDPNQVYFFVNNKDFKLLEERNLSRSVKIK